MTYQISGSPWWIHNTRLADFCGIKHDCDLHNTTILGKYIPRGETFWDRSPGLHSKMLKINKGMSKTKSEC